MVTVPGQVSDDFYDIDYADVEVCSSAGLGRFPRCDRSFAPKAEPAPILAR
jgi:hypothetical protein